MPGEGPALRPLPNPRGDPREAAKLCVLRHARCAGCSGWRWLKATHPRHAEQRPQVACRSTQRAGKGGQSLISRARLRFRRGKWV